MRDDWKKAAAPTYPTIPPCRPAGFSMGSHLGTILIAGHDESVVMVISGKDLETLKMFIAIAEKENDQSAK